MMMESQGHKRIEERRAEEEGKKPEAKHTQTPKKQFSALSTCIALRCLIIARSSEMEV
jgi:hypothetical protein